MRLSAIQLGKAAVAELVHVVDRVANRLEHGQHADRDDRQRDHYLDQREPTRLRCRIAALDLDAAVGVADQRDARAAPARQT